MESICRSKKKGRKKDFLCVGECVCGRVCVWESVCVAWCGVVWCGVEELAFGGVELCYTIGFDVFGFGVCENGLREMEASLCAFESSMKFFGMRMGSV